ncbi:MAG: OmpA family protein [candidate division Zixibacteria bacterium]|nr:OmpA family protein [candidate division Zixibacteria bacterium]
MQKFTLKLITPAVLMVFCAMLAMPTEAADFRYTLGLHGEVATVTGGEGYKFPLRRAYGMSLGYAVSEHWDLDVNLGWYDLYDDLSATSSFSFRNDSTLSSRRFQATRLGAEVKRILLPPGGLVNISLGLGGGLLIWRMADPGVDTTLEVPGSRNETVDYSSTEVFVTGLVGTEIALSSHFALNLDLHVDYLTGAGTEFADEISSARDRWLVGSSVGLSFSFGPSGFQRGWPSQRAWSLEAPTNTKKPKAATDSDGDGIPDSDDRCHATPTDVIVDRHGCPLDSDRDGVFDGLDDCDGTDPRARNKVDIFGCPLDSDFDGVPDYRDACPHNAVGAFVDEGGCPLDSDADGIPDGLDDCPGTLYGIDVDPHGCVDLSVFAKPMIMNIDYAPGSFEVDPNNMDRLRELARILNFVPIIKLEINGYTDNIGLTSANQTLSDKRARRVRDYLVAMDVASERIRVFGRGETSFVASNQTEADRAKNRRIEIIFYR